MSLYDNKKTLRISRNKCKANNEYWQECVKGYKDKIIYKLAPVDRKRLKSVLGLRSYPGPIRASDLPATLKFGLCCIDAVHTYWRAVDRLRWFHVTLFADEFHVSERKPFLALKRLKGKAYKEIKELGLHGLIFIDVHPLPNYPQGGKGGTFLFHVHAVCFVEGHFDLPAARQALNRSRSWSSCLEAKPATINEITKEMGTPGYWAGYGSKPPHDAKNLMVKADGSNTLFSTKKYRRIVAFRLVEGLAQLEMMQMVFSVGEGKDLREHVRKAIKNWHRTRWPDQRPVKPFDVPKLFKRIWPITRAKNYKKWRIVGGLG